MKIVRNFYYWLHKKTSLPGEEREYSSGFWQYKVRDIALELSEGLSFPKLLEVGCGEGLFLNRAKKELKNYELIGLDIWEDILLKAKTRLHDKGVNLIQANACFLPFKDDSFDVVVCINVFFNLPSEEIFYQSLSEILRVCKKEKFIIFDIRNKLNPLLYIKYKLAKYYDETVKNLPLRTYSPQKVISYLEERGHKIIEKRYIGFPDNKFSPIIILKVKK
ncbi:MAG TPA: class I SAM-dependent methyltransferase [Candidatus Omnitrophica bacterium]|nr:class I SAM-dependent methyltransferase [Candidatus Omnitrophota bacterium]